MTPPGIRDALVAVKEAMAAGRLDVEAVPDLGYDADFVRRTAPLLDFFFDTYFRVRLLGTEHVPRTGAAMLVANHSGGIPYDGAILCHAVRRITGGTRALRPLVASFVFQSSWMSQVVARFGGVRASMDSGTTLLGQGQLVGVFPEGLKGVGKMYRERYRLRHFGRGGFVRLARAAGGVPIVPVAIVGAEEIHPVIGKMTTLAEPLGIPYIPITPTFPWFGPLGLLPVPSKWTIAFGAPIAIPGKDEGGGAELTSDLAELVRSRVDDMIASILTRRRSVLFG